MKPEFYAVIATAIVSGGLILNARRAIGERLACLEGGMSTLRERLSRLEERRNTLQGHRNAIGGRLSAWESLIVQVFGRKSAPRYNPHPSPFPSLSPHSPRPMKKT